MFTLFSDKILKNKDYEKSKDRSKIVTKTGVIGLVINLLLFLIKFIIGTMIHSISLTADAFNNLSDSAGVLISIVGFKSASKQADKDHPYGHGRIEYITGLFISLLVILVGYQFVVSSFKIILNPNIIDYQTITIIILALSLIFKLFIYSLNKNVGKKIDSKANLAIAHDSIADVFATITVILALVFGSYTSFPVDGLAGVLIGIYIFYSGYSLTKSTIYVLLGEKPDEALIENLKKEVLLNENIYGVHDLRIHSYGPTTTMATIDAEVPHDIDLILLHNSIDKTERAVLDKYNIELVTHIDPINIHDTDYIESLEKATKIALTEKYVKSIHDFRYTGDDDNKIIIFEAVVSSKDTTEEDRKKIKKSLKNKIAKEFKNAKKIIIYIDLDVSML